MELSHGIDSILRKGMVSNKSLGAVEIECRCDVVLDLAFVHPVVSSGILLEM